MGQLRGTTLLLLLFLAWHVHRLHVAEGAVAGMPCHTCIGFMGQVRGTTLLLLLLLAWHVHRLHGAVEGYCCWHGVPTRVHRLHGPGDGYCTTAAGLPYHMGVGFMAQVRGPVAGMACVARIVRTYWCEVAGPW